MGRSTDCRKRLFSAAFDRMHLFPNLVATARRSVTAGLLLLTVSTAFAFNSGDRVQCNSTNVNVRSSPSTSGTILGQVNSPTRGTVQSGPYSGSGFTWYYVNWDTGINGYTVQDYYQLVPAVSITTTAFNPSTATVGVGYSANSAVTATGGQTPYTWSATGFPTGMSINSSTGAPFGTPTVAGTFNVTVTVKDSSSPQQTASKVLTLTVSSSTLSITSTAFNPSTATVGVGYSANSAVSATGGQTPYTWSATGFPNGMSINSSTGAPFGTPTVAGTFNVTVTVRDSSSPQKSASKTLTLTVNSSALSITSTAFNPSTATVGVGYSANAAMTATGGQTPYSWSATGFPNGMSINSSTGAPFGAPTVAGTFNVTVTVRDSSSTQQTASKTLTLTVNASGVSITTTAFNPSTAAVGMGYAANAAVAATGGQTPYTWSATGFPNGMSINSSSGAPFGTPTVAGTFNVTVTVRDSSSPQQSASKTLTLTVSSSTLSITTTAFNPATAMVGVGYSANSAVTASGGQMPYTWSATGFPNGMSINSSTGAPYGTSTVSGTFNVTVTVRDSSSSQQTASKTLLLTVAGPGASPPTVQTLTATSVTSNSVVINGTIADTGGSVVDDRRFDWGSSQPLSNPVYAQSINVSGNNFSATLTGLSPNATYYFRAWAHNNSTTNIGYGVGWNTGTIIPVVTAPTTSSGLPVIIDQPSDGVLPSTGSIVLAVRASSTNLQYHWYRDGTSILGATNPSLSVSVPASYWVVITNSVGSVTSRHALVSSGAVVAAPSGQPSTGTVTADGPIDPKLPTIVITHGWQWADVYDGTLPAWVVEMKTEIRKRLDRANYPPLSQSGQRVNIITFGWQEAYTGDKSPELITRFLYASSFAHREGLLLAARLETLLGSAYSGDIQFIGHSLGTIVNGYAGEKLSHIGVMQFTILDAPLKYTYYSQLFFAEHLGFSQVDWVDNYIATALLPLPPGVGDTIAGSAPDGGRRVSTNHTGMHDQYLGTITDDTNREGFYNSVILGPKGGYANRPSPQTWRPSFSASDIDIIIDVGAHLPEITTEGFHIVQGKVQQFNETVKGAVRETIHLFTGLFGESNSSSSDGVRRAAVDVVAGPLGSNDAAVVLDVSMPVNATTLTFDYRFPIIVPGDWMSVSFNNTLLYSFPADASAQTDFQTAEVPVASVGGQTGLLVVTLHSSAATQTELIVSNFKFSTPRSDVARLSNIATRLSVGTGDNALIAGFIVTGTQPKKVILRGIGPSLNVTGKLANPTLELRNSSGALVDFNDNWIDSPNKQAISDTTIAPSNDLESAIVATLPANSSAYTAILRGVNNATGIGVVEAYDLDSTVDSKLANISTRGFVDTGDNVMIGGSIVTGSVPANVLFRAIGPSLSSFGVANPLQDPVLELHDTNGGIIAVNDNWRDSQEAAITATGIPPSDNRESAILANLPPGAYTAIVRGSGNSTGVALVEAYQLQ
jgi:P2-related tail formation protein